MQFTNEATTVCEKKAVFAIDVLDHRRRLLVEPIPVTETLDDCSCGPQKCGYLEKWINMERAAAGKAVLPGNTVTPSSTIAEVVAHVC